MYISCKICSNFHVAIVVGDREENTSISEDLALDHTEVHFKVSSTPGEQHLYVIQILEQKKVIEEKYVDLNSQSSQNEGYNVKNF